MDKYFHNLYPQWKSEQTRIPLAVTIPAVVCLVLSCARNCFCCLENDLLEEWARGDMDVVGPLQKVVHVDVGDTP